MNRIGMGAEPRAAYAADPTSSRGRVQHEAASRTRTDFQRDRDRIVHSTAFRRLKHKTQVFIAYEGDHFRTRLTHTIEVSQIARAFARAFRLDEDLTEAIALAHDLGHTPFGHAGERALGRKMRGFGGFDHNAQTLRIVTALEQRYAAFDGLNLSWETLEGLVKHNGPLRGRDAAHPVPRPISEFDALFPLALDLQGGMEAQVAAISDDIAYDAHDLDDGLRAGLFEVADLSDLDLAGSILREVRVAYPGLDRTRTIHEIMRRHITLMVEDVIATSMSNLETLAPTSADAIRSAAHPVAAFSPAMRGSELRTKRFLFERVYRNPAVTRVMGQAEEIVSDLFDRYMVQPLEMKGDWSDDIGSLNEQRLARRVCDYISGMTDGYATSEHRRLFDATPHLR